MPFQPGNKLGGRPKDSKWVKHLASQRTEDAIRALTEALDATRVLISPKGEVVGEEPDHRVRVMAANALLDRAHGKPSQEVTATVINTNPDELHERIITALAEVGSIDDAGPTGEPH